MLFIFSTPELIKETYGSLRQLFSCIGVCSIRQYVELTECEGARPQSLNQCLRHIDQIYDDKNTFKTLELTTVQFYFNFYFIFVTISIKSQSGTSCWKCKQVIESEIVKKRSILSKKFQFFNYFYILLQGKTIGGFVQ